MNEKPIIFSAESVRAIKAGRKTQTRRVLKPQPEKCQNGGWTYNDQHFADDAQMQSHLFHNVYGNGKCPYGGVYADGTSDLLWVRETWAPHRGMDDTSPAEFGPGAQNLPLWYRADIGNTNRERGRWRASIHMPRWASRLTLGIVDVRDALADLDAMHNGATAGTVWDDETTGNEPLRKLDGFPPIEAGE